LKRIAGYISKPTNNAPLVIFRIIFGTLMFGALIRFWSKGWIRELYIDPEFYFSYKYFEWVKPLGDPGMYILFGISAISALGIALGAFYRLSATSFLLSFTYIELLDKTNYLNHYYFVSIVAFLLILLPAHRRFSIDAWRKPQLSLSQTPFYNIGILKVQLGLVYFFAGLAKLNSDWLIHAQPLKIWLKMHGHLPFIGWLFDTSWLPYFFSWFGAIYDLSIPFLLIANRTRPLAYLAVIVFHVLTALLFPIGMFPFIMIGATLIFFPPKFHENLLKKLGEKKDFEPIMPAIKSHKLAPVFFAAFIGFQVLIPFRSLLYPGELFWHEQGYRFSWRVMLMEKSGAAFFYVDGDNCKRPMEVQNREFLTPNQEKMMATQPDMIVQYAQYLKDVYAERGISNPQVSARIYVSLNGRPSELFIDPEINLAELEDNWSHKTWIKPFNEKITGI